MGKKCVAECGVMELSVFTLIFLIGRVFITAVVINLLPYNVK